MDSFRQRIAAAKQRSQTGLALLMISLYKGTCSRAQIDELYPVLIDCFDDEYDPSGAPIHRTTLEPAKLAAASLTLVIQEWRKEDPSKMPLVASWWPRILPWLLAFTKHYVHNSAISIEERATGKATVLEIMHSFISNEALHEVLNTTPPALSLLIDIWMLECREPRLNPMRSKLDPGKAKEGLVPYFRLITPESGEYFFENMHIGMDVRAIARTALDCLQWDIKRSNLHEINYDVYVIQYLSINDTMALALLSQHSPVVVTNAIVLLSCTPAGRRYTFSDVGKAAALRYLCRSLEFGDGRAWTIQALDANLLGGLLCCASSTEADVTESVMALLSTVLPKYLIYESILVAVGRGFEEIEEAGLEKEVTLPDDLSSKWNEFRSHAFRHLMLATCWSKSHKGSKLNLKYPCNYLPCSKVMNRSDVKRCAGCMLGYYCSREHQRLDWKALHRGDCQRTQTIHEGGSFPGLQKRDEAFIRTLVQYLLFKERFVMDQFVKEQDTDTVAVEYNFHTIPYTMNFGTVDSCPVDDAETFELAKPRWYQTLETRDSQEGNMAITRAYIPVGGRSLILITMMPLPPTEGISTLADPLMEVSHMWAEEGTTWKDLRAEILS